jgi:hypothetical protein
MFDLKLSRRVNVVKSSRSISRINVESKTNQPRAIIPDDGDKS